MYEVYDTDNERLIGRAETAAGAVELGLMLCDRGELTLDEAVAEYMAAPNAGEAYGLSVREVASA